jgi:cytidylate kinase
VRHATWGCGTLWDVHPSSSPESPTVGRRVVVAIDGPAGAGKSTTARLLAARLGYALLDTGAIYRTLALLAHRAGISWSEGSRVAELARALDIRFRLEGAVNRVFVGAEEMTGAIRAPDVSEGASQVSALPEVRDALLDLQRRLGADGGVVVEGRDIGTVVFPAASAKFFLTAAPEERARRRALELRTLGRPADEAAVLAEILARDHRDMNRATAPLKKAADAIEIDSSEVGVDAVVDLMADRIERLGATAAQAASTAPLSV